MKKLIALVLAVLLLAGCTPAPANVPEEAPAESVAAEHTVSETDGLDTPMTEEEAAAAEAAKAEEIAERERTKALPVGTFSAETLTGTTVTESIFTQAELTVVNIWATYCGPCKEEIPILAQLHEEMAGEVQIMGVLLDCTDEEDNVIEAQLELARELADGAGVTYENLLLNQSLMDCGFGAVSAVPATIFVDKDGNTVGMGFYGSLDETGWRDTIAERLEIARSRY